MKAGEVVFTSEPFAYVLNRSQWRIRCDYCLEKNEKLKKCTQCSLLHYCDRKCQKQDWKQHKVECAGLKRVHPQVPTDFARFLARIIMKLKDPSSEKCDVTLNNIKRNFSDLMSHEENIKNDESRARDMMLNAEILKEFLGEHMPSMQEFLAIYGKAVINSFGICDEEMQPIASGLYLGASALDHSCCPNAVTMFRGPKLEIRATEDIVKPSFQNVFVSYIESLQTTQERRTQLRRQYYFDCDCRTCQDKTIDKFMTSIKCSNDKCSEPVLTHKGELTNCQKCSANNASRVDMAIDIMQASNKALKQLNALKKAEDFSQLLVESEKQLELQVLLHPLNVWQIRVLDFAFDAAIEMQEWEKAASFGSRTLQGYRKYYGKTNVLLGIQLMKTGKLYHYLCQPEKSLPLLVEAEAVLCITHSTNHPLYQSLLEMIKTSKYELNCALVDNK